MDADQVENNIYRWKAYVDGPKDTPYEDGRFFLDINIPENYPFSPPKITFKSRIYHCNVSKSGEICLDILKDQWSAALTISKCISSISLLLSQPNPDDPLVASIAHQYY